MEATNFRGHATPYVLLIALQILCDGEGGVPDVEPINNRQVFRCAKNAGAERGSEVVSNMSLSVLKCLVRV